MQSETATVVRVDSEHLVLRTTRKRTCSGCNLKGGCGQYLLSREDEELQLPRAALAPGERAPRAGDSVQVQLAPAQLLVLTAWFYVLPLLGLLLGTAFAAWQELDEGTTMALAAASLAAGLAASRRRLAGTVARHAASPSISRTSPETETRHA